MDPRDDAKYGRCYRCGEVDFLGEHDDLCAQCAADVRWEEITAINCNPQVDEIEDDDDFYAKDQGSYGDVDQVKLEGMDAVYAWEDDHPQCRNCGERLNTEDGCHCDNPMGPDDE